LRAVVQVVKDVQVVKNLLVDFDDWFHPLGYDDLDD